MYITLLFRLFELICYFLVYLPSDLESTGQVRFQQEILKVAHWVLLNPFLFLVPTAWVQGSPLTEEVYELIDYPAKGFALELKSVDKLDRVADNAYKVPIHNQR